MNIGKRILELRTNAGLTQEILSEKLGISRQSVAKWEGNLAIPDIDRLVELSKLFGISVDFLLKGKNDYSKNIASENIEDYEIKNFLCIAKKNTYAAHGVEIISCRLCSHDLEFKDGDFYYLDSYFGGEKFIGEEVLFFNKIPLWSMNYSGRVIDRNFSGDFLKECLLNVSIEKPFRGPDIYQNGNFTYHSNIKGDFEWFTGEEEIFFHSKKIYECVFHGGKIL